MSADIHKPRVFLVDDDAAIRRTLTKALIRRDIEVECFESAQAFLSAYDGQPGCLVLDLTMPGMSGLELQQELARAEMSIPIVFISGQADVPKSVEAIKAGAVDFLEKPFVLDELFERIEEALAADAVQRSEQAYRDAIRERFAALTEREREVMCLMIAGAATASSKEIAAELGISHRTVHHHRTRIMEKTRARSVTELARLASWAGIVEPDLEAG